jgi:hypothetical protein
MGEKCIIDDPSLGILTENDHRLGLCLCAYCTCGNHVCTSKNLFNSHPVKLKSTYLTSFSKVPVTRLLKETRTVSPIIKKTFTGISTYKNDFVKQDSTPHPRAAERIKKPMLTGVIRSSYTKDFIPFNPIRQESMSPPNPRPDGKSLKFQSETTYKNTFISPNSEQKTKSYSKLAKKIFIDPNSYLETSHKRDFQQITPQETCKSNLQSSFTIPSKTIPFQSSNQRDFILPQESVKNLPRRLTALREYIIHK